jgi:hypothetical protein
MKEEIRVIGFQSGKSNAENEKQDKPWRSPLWIGKNKRHTTFLQMDGFSRA